jgi:[citrate (pro-3S)-lyase] ligase
MTFGFAVRDEGTIASKLQYILNKSYDENTIGVENHGIFTVSTDMFLEFTSIFISLPIKKRDILLVQTTGEADINCADIFARPHDYGEVYWDCYHLTERGNTIVAKKIYDYLRSTRVLSVCKRDSDFGNEYITNSIPNDNHALRYGFSEREGERLNEYKRKLAALYKEIRAKHGPNPNIGAAAMNCNPFTLGHLHLIETAAAKVDHLVIFVVREDKSEFPFADRIELVKRGTEHIPNISVLESGEFIGSVKTFSAYFNKEASQDVPIDASLDACIFGAEISPALRIKTRFVGDEPLDKVTRRYNETLVAILPRYGVRVEIIPRHSIDGAVVSASTVRRLIAERKFDEIAKIVPAATYEHLLERTASVPH